MFFARWGVVRKFGGECVAGRVKGVRLFGTRFVRVEIPQEGGGFDPHFCPAAVVQSFAPKPRRDVLKMLADFRRETAAKQRAAEEGDVIPFTPKRPA